MVEIDMEFMKSHRALGRPVATDFAVRMAQFLTWVGSRTPRRVENCRIPDHPVVFATNHTHVVDFLPLWIELLRRDEKMVGWVKARMYKKRNQRLLMRFLGNNIPLVSKGYLIAADFRQLVGRPPDEEEYRRLRDHVDHRRPLPEGGAYGDVRSVRRAMLGRRFNPDQESYRRAMIELFYEMMQQALAKARQCVEQGYHMHIYPEGVVGKRLGRGHTGIIHAAMALDMPIVPVGISGTVEAFVGDSPLTWGGEFRLRFGEPLTVDSNLVKPGFRPFHPEDQVACDEAFQNVVDQLMLRLNELLDSDYQYEKDEAREVRHDVGRFY